MAHDLVQSDNVDVTLNIGTRLEGSPPETVNDNEWEIIDCEVVLTQATTPDYVDMIITPAKGTAFPERPGVEFSADPNEPGGSPGGFFGRYMTLDVDTELRADTDEAETTRLFTGQIGNMTALGDYTYEAIGYDRSQQQFNVNPKDKTSFMNQTINFAPPSPRIRRTLGGAGPYIESFSPGDNRIPVNELVQLVLDEAGVPESRRVIDLDDDQNEEITFSSWEVTIKEILDRTTEAANAEWFFDRFGNFYFKTPEADEDIFAYTLSYITDASDGKQSPPWRSVRVIGDGVASKEGWERSALINEAPITSQESLAGVELDEETTELAEPVFTYRNMEINTQQEADNVAKKVLEKLQKQQGSGTVTVVGFPEVRPYDAIEMPNTERQPMGGERYGVEQVTHRLNASDGFITKIKLSGLVGYQEVLFTEDVRSLEGELSAQWSNLVAGELDGFAEGGQTGI